MKNLVHSISGSIPALITPMLYEDGKEIVDIDALEKFIDWQIVSGSHCLVSVGTTGESPTLTTHEHKQIVEITIKVSSGRVPIIAGTGSNSTLEAIELTKHAQNIGADAALVVTPYYNKPTQDGLYLHFEAIAKNSDIPIIIYNIPGRSVVDMSVDTIARLAEIPNIVGLKDATGDLARVAEQRLALGDDFIQLSGEDMTAVGFNAMGGTGCISVTANVAPKLCADLQNACKSGDYKKALELQDVLAPLHKAMFMETSPSPVKYAASLLGLSSSHVRLPMTPVSDTTKIAIKKAIEDITEKTEIL